ncbi:ketopantoate reductase family protein [Mechercharimyces sp. CAU 1602]|uniref:ketopantoate reductase family protein n=1 Tax=Mechercharimyces sp. CAU 1602 TaxID=2973933 RepID=UPI0021633EF6|nr:2-dehydropantoate 2-reductase [Mechercharimyces sp. CAU 1602]MCS1351442.1 2-dehydropantoate 2-reductase [Mechercharimyces sp. CAU 1602]
MNKNVVIVGAGAIGGTLAAWISPHHPSTYVLDRGVVAEAIKTNGITTYLGGKEAEKQTVRVNSIDDLSQIEAIDILIIAVKTYSLEAVCQAIREKIEGEPIVVALQNGIENQDILPRYFKRILYGVIGYNAWLDQPGTIGYQHKGPFILGTPTNDLRLELNEVSTLFNQGVETIITTHLQDAVHSKIILNLTNSFTTLVGHKHREISDFKLFKKILTNILVEGIEIVQANGYKECQLGDMPSWRKMKATVQLPQILTNGIFRRNMKKMVISSMGQDILVRGNSDSELESINGYMIQLADRKQLAAPYNRAIYALCKEEFSKPSFKPLSEEQVWEYLQSFQKA